MTNNETTNPYTIDENGKRVFTINTLKQLVVDYNNEQTTPVDLSDDDRTILMFLEKTLKIKLIVFGMFDHNNPIQTGDVVLYKKIPYRLIKITEENGDELYDLYNGYEEIKNVPKKNIEDNPNDLFKHFRIYCNDDELNMEFNDYMYIIITNVEQDTVNDKNKQDKTIKYQLVQSINKPYIFTADEIPIYIKYFIFNSCQTPDKNELYRIGFSEPKLQDDILDFSNKRRERIDKININEDIVKNEEKIKKYKTKYKKLKENKFKTLEEQLKQNRLREDIKDLEQIKNNLKAHELDK